MKKILVILIIISLFISGCSSTLSKSSNNQDMIESIIPEGESEIGKLTLFKKNDKVEAIQESGPFTVKINKM